MAESVQQQIARLKAEILRLEAQHPKTATPGLDGNVVEERGVTITAMDDIRSGDLPTETEVDQLLTIVGARRDDREFRINFVHAIRFLGNVGRLDNAVNMKIIARDWMILGEDYMTQLGIRSVSFAGGALWTACVACGAPYQPAYPERGIPARLGLVWDRDTPRAHSRWRQILQRGKSLPPITIGETHEWERQRPSHPIVHRNVSPSGMT